MNASTTFDKAAAVASKLVSINTGGHGAGTSDVCALAAHFPSERKADVCRLLAEALKEKANRNGLSSAATLTKALDGAKGFTTLQIASLKAFWQLAVVADSVVNAKGNAAK